MILPQSYFGALIVLILSLLCLGLWANTYKLAGKLRFELYAIDFAVGLGLAAFLFAFTMGNLGYDGFSFLDDLMQVHKRQWLDAVGAGVIFNLGNMLLLGSVSLASLATAFPIALGLGLVIGILLEQISKHNANPLYLGIGCAVILIAIVAAAIAHNASFAARQAEVPKTGKKGSRGPSSLKGLVLAMVSGLLFGIAQPLSNAARTGDVFLGPYSFTFLFGAGFFLSTFVFSLFFMNLPVQGQPLEVTDVFKGAASRHLYGFLGGVICCAGMVGILAATASAAESHVTRGMTTIFSYGGAFVAGLSGLLFWKECEKRGKGAAFLGLLLFAAGLGLLSMAIS
jgi:glucose uptake protein